MPARHTVSTGDRFVRVGNPHKIFVVTRIDERPHHPPHARLQALTTNKEEITIAVGTLIDRRFFLVAPEKR